MGCEHKRIMSRNCVLYCMDCGAKLDKPPEPGEKKQEPKRPTRKKTKAD